MCAVHTHRLVSPRFIGLIWRVLVFFFFNCVLYLIIKLLLICFWVLLPPSPCDRTDRPRMDSFPEYSSDYLDVMSAFWQRKTDFIFEPRSYQRACHELRDLLNHSMRRPDKGKHRPPVTAGRPTPDPGAVSSGSPSPATDSASPPCKVSICYWSLHFSQTSATSLWHLHGYR